jgi:hypothetical protein
MSRSDDVIMLPIPLDLCSRGTPSTQSHKRLIARPQIPASNPTVHTDCCHKMRIPGVPVDIGDCPRMSVD